MLLLLVLSICNTKYIVMCQLWPEARGWAKPGPKKLGLNVGLGFGKAKVGWGLGCCQIRV